MAPLAFENLRKPPRAPEKHSEARRAADARAELALELFAQGVATVEIVRHLRQRFTCSQGSAYASVKRARQALSPLLNPEQLEERRAQAVARAESLYQHCVEAKDHSTALTTLRWIGELQGLTGPQQIAHHHHATLIQVASIRSQSNGTTEAHELRRLSEDELVQRAEEQIGKLKERRRS